MNLKEIKIKLDKLNRYFDFLNSLDGKISALDKDAFLGQLRELYVLSLFDEVKQDIVEHQPVFHKTVEPIAKEELTIVKEEPLKKSPTIIFNEPTKFEPVQELPPKEETIQIEKTEEKSLPTEIINEKAAVPTIVEQPKSTGGLLPEHKETRISVDEIVPLDEKTEEVDFNGDFEELFIFKQATDLAAKLSESPIANLNKALGVNEKLYYLRELFGGDTSKFNDALEFFNEAGIFEKARAYMEANLIETHNWISKEKKNIAKEFVKLVRRRYL
jgi:hypothetical protein